MTTNIWICYNKREPKWLKNKNNAFKIIISLVLTIFLFSSGTTAQATSQTFEGDTHYTTSKGNSCVLSDFDIYIEDFSSATFNDSQDVIDHIYDENPYLHKTMDLYAYTNSTVPYNIPETEYEVVPATPGGIVVKP